MGNLNNTDKRKMFELKLIKKFNAISDGFNIDSSYLGIYNIKQIFDKCNIPLLYILLHFITFALRQLHYHVCIIYAFYVTAQPILTPIFEYPNHCHIYVHCCYLYSCSFIAPRVMLRGF